MYLLGELNSYEFFKDDYGDVEIAVEKCIIVFLTILGGNDDVQSKIAIEIFEGEEFLLRQRLGGNKVDRSLTIQGIMRRRQLTSPTLFSSLNEQ